MNVTLKNLNVGNAFSFLVGNLILPNLISKYI